MKTNFLPVLQLDPNDQDSIEIYYDDEEATAPANTGGPKHDAFEWAQFLAPLIPSTINAVKGNQQVIVQDSIRDPQQPIHNTANAGMGRPGTPSNKPSKGLIIGIVVGFILLVLIILFFLKKK